MGQPVELAQPLLVISVPDIDVSVAAAGGEGVVVLVEADGVHRVDVLDAVLLHPVALERVLLLLRLGARVQVLHGHPGGQGGDGGGGEPLVMVTNDGGGGSGGREGLNVCKHFMYF